MYGHALKKRLPLGGYEWLSSDDVLFTNRQAILNLSDESNKGYLFEVDLHYPKHLHDKHNDYPFCPERRLLPSEALDFIEKMTADCRTDEDEKKKKISAIRKSKIQKLLLTFYDKKNYVLDYRMLKLALTHGLELKKVHRILKFRQSCWMKPYIDLNIEHRKKAVNKFETEFFKLLINSVFGKTMENLRARVDIKLVNKWEGRCGARMLIARPNFKNCRIFDENLVAIELQRTSILMNKPVIIGTCVLDLSKITMYKFLYEYLKPKYKDKCRVVYTDTDSFILAIETDDFYEDIRNNIDMFDTSNYSWPNDYNIELKNQGIDGLFKDELKGKIMIEIVGLRAKCYAIRIQNEAPHDLIKKSKGVKRSVVETKIKFEDFLKCFEEHREISCEQKTIRSMKHNLYSIEQKKIALSPCDDKRFVEKNKSDTLAWGHYKISDMIENQHLI